ncbi:MAG: GAP family protein [Mycobacterium sp.]
MLRDVILMTLLVVFNPFLLAIILLLVSRPRPAQNLFVYWVGCMITNVPIFLVPLVALHVVPSFSAFAHDVATPAPGTTIKPIQIGAGVVMLLVSCLVAIRHQRQQRTEIVAPVPVGRGGGDSAVLLLERPEPPTSAPRPPGRFDELLTRAKAVLERANAAWEGGNLWLSLLFGMGCVPSLTMVLLVDGLIVGSGAPIAMQIVVAIVFVITMFIVLEAALLSNVFAPGKTQALLKPLHTWSAAHAHQTVYILLAVVGVWNLIAGTGLV